MLPTVLQSAAILHKAHVRFQAHTVLVQVVLCGDFHQLPPIPERLTVDQRREAIQQRHSNAPQLSLPFLNRGMAFEAATWLTAGFRVHQLRQVHRQDNVSFIDVLHNIREGSQSPAQMQHLEDTCCRQGSAPLLGKKDHAGLKDQKARSCSIKHPLLQSACLLLLTEDEI